MDLNLDSDEALNVYKALASDTRIDILKILIQNSSTVSELSKILGYSKAIISRYLKILENAHLIKCNRQYESDMDGRKRIYQIAVDHIDIEFPKKVYLPFKKITEEIRLGYYSDFSVEPTCGLASATDHIGEIDDPRAFASNERIEASLLWLSRGYVEYIIPNALEENFHPELVEFSLELSSEFPGSNNNWPSDISLFINDVKVAVITVPGNFSDVRGKYTPAWWPDLLSQYGLLKTIRINHDDTSINGIKVSDATLDDLELTKSHFIKLRLEVEESSKNVGGLTIFGDSFGNHPQNIMYNLYYSQKNVE